MLRQNNAFKYDGFQGILVGICSLFFILTLLEKLGVSLNADGSVKHGCQSE